MNGQGQECYGFSLDEKKKRVSFVFLCTNGVRGFVKGKDMGQSQAAHSMVGRMLDYFGAHSTTHPNQHRHENTDTSHLRASIIPAVGQCATAVIFTGGWQQGKGCYSLAVFCSIH